MDWRHVIFDWNRARAFLVTAEEGSLSAAARALGMSQPTIGRQIARLEAELGVLLFDREGTRLRLTPSGLELLDHAKAMGEAAGQFALTASGQAQALEGVVRITASELFSAYLLGPVIAALWAEHPGLQFEIVAENELRDLRRREADIAVRNARPTDPDLIAKLIREDEAVLFGAPDYLASLAGCGLKGARIIGFDATPAYAEALHAHGVAVQNTQFPLWAARQIVHLQMAKQGVGLAVLPRFIGQGERGLIQAAPAMRPITYPIWLVAHRELLTSRRMRLVFDRLAEALECNPISVNR